MLYCIAWLLLQPLRLLYKAYGRDNMSVCKNNACIVVANHVDIFDPWKIGPHYSRKIVWFCKEELYSFECTYEECKREYKHSHCIAWLRAKFTVWLVKNSSTIPVDRENPKSSTNRRAMVQAMKLLKRGGVLGIFPTGKVGSASYSEINTIFWKFAYKSGASVVPVLIGKNNITFLKPVKVEKSDIIPNYIKNIICT